MKSWMQSTLAVSTDVHRLKRKKPWQHGGEHIGGGTTLIFSDRRASLYNMAHEGDSSSDPTVSHNRLWKQTGAERKKKKHLILSVWPFEDGLDFKRPRVL